MELKKTKENMQTDWNSMWQ